MKKLSSQIDSLFKRTMNLTVGRAILDRISKSTDIADDLVFSVGALFYREEKYLVELMKKVEDSAKELLSKLNKEKVGYGKDKRELGEMMNKLKDKKKLSKHLGREAKKEGLIIDEDERRRDELLSFLRRLRNLTLGIDNKIHDTHLEAKAQRRKAVNLLELRTQVPLRSSFRLGELVGRRGIELGSLVKRTKKKLKHFKRIVGRKKRLDKAEEDELIKYCRMEAEDLREVFMFVLQINGKMEHWLKRLRENILKNPRLAALRNEYNRVNLRLETLRKDIQTQYRRLDNEIKKGGIEPSAQIQRQMKRAA